MTKQEKPDNSGRRLFLKGAGTGAIGTGVLLKSMASKIESGARERDIPIPPHTENSKIYMPGTNQGYTLTDVALVAGTAATVASLITKAPESNSDIPGNHKITVHVASRREMLATAAVTGAGSVGAYFAGKAIGKVIVDKAAADHAKELKKKNAATAQQYPSANWVDNERSRDRDAQDSRER